MENGSQHLYAYFSNSYLIVYINKSKIYWKFKTRFLREIFSASIKSADINSKRYFY